MMNVKKKTYNDSYLYNIDGNKHNQMLMNFIITSDRIEDKNSTEFAGIVEDIKRVQRSSVLYNLLMTDNVVICINKGDGLPRPFKVFMAKDIKEGRAAKRKIFIDATGILTIKNGYYTCKNIQYLVTYLFQALCYYIYDNDTMKVVGNSAICKSGAQAYASMFCYILDYMRIIGYEQSKFKIAYLAAIFYLNSMLGKDIDQYTKNIAATVAGVSPSISNAWDMYYKANDLTDIDTFVTFIAETFKLKGLTTEVFVGKWVYSYSPSSTYACEVFTSFAGVMAATYLGSYLVNQKQIEKSCGKDMINFCTEVLKIGSNSLGLTENAIVTREAFVIKDKNTMSLKEALFGNVKVPDEAKFTGDDYTSKAKAEAKAKSLIKWYTANNKTDKISGKLYQATLGAQALAGLWIEKPDEGKYEVGTTEALVKAGKKYFNDKNRKLLKEDFNKSMATFEKAITKAQEKEDKAKVKRLGEVNLELKKCLSALG